MLAHYGKDAMALLSYIYRDQSRRVGPVFDRLASGAPRTAESWGPEWMLSAWRARNRKHPRGFRRKEVDDDDDDDDDDEEDEDGEEEDGSTIPFKCLPGSWRKAEDQRRGIGPR